MNVEETKPTEFPYNLPADNQVTIRPDVAKLEVLDQEMAEIFCNVCCLPMSTKIQLIPCNHLLCFKCFEKFNQECKKCGFEIVDVKHSQNNF